MEYGRVVFVSLISVFILCYEALILARVYFGNVRVDLQIKGCTLLV